MPELITVDGNEAAARAAHMANEVISIYPITPASPMGELCRQPGASRAVKKEHLRHRATDVIEMQSEGGAAGGRAWLHCKPVR